MLGAAEAAVLFAAGHVEAARLTLENVCARQSHEQRAWLMLLDLHRAQDQRAAFDAVHERYRNACPDGPQPLWNYPTRPAASERLELAGRLATEDQLRALFAYARTHKLVAIDLAGVSRIDLEFAPKLCAALRLFALQAKRVILMHLSPLHEELLVTLGLHRDVTVLARVRDVEELDRTQHPALKAA